MISITITLQDGLVKTLRAKDNEAPAQFDWGYAVLLTKPIFLDDVPILEDMPFEFNEDAKVDLNNGVAFEGKVEIFTAHDDLVLLKINKVNKVIPVLQTNENYGVGAYSGKVGPFNYEVDAHLDMENFTNSAFMVQLSYGSVIIADVYLNSKHTTAKIGASISWVGVEGTLGVDFDKQCIYASIILKYGIGEMKYDFDLYQWGNYNVIMLPVVQNEEYNDVSEVVQLLQNGDVGGSITVRNKGGYVAKIRLAFTLNGQRIEKESELFTAGVNSQIEIPAGAKDIQVEALAAWFVGVWSSIFTKGYETPQYKSFEVSGTTLNTKYKEL